MLQYLSTEEKALSRDLWEEAFPEDSRSFDDYYFEEKLKDNRILAILEDGRVQAMVQMNPYLVQVGDRRWRVDYLVGVATRKEKRHQGYMRRLLLQMMQDMRDEQMPFCFLMPADEAIYRPFGFTYIFRQPQMALRKDVEAELVRRPLIAEAAGPGVAAGGSGAVAGGSGVVAAGSRAYLESLAGWMQRWLKRHYQVFAVRDGAYLLRLMKEIASEDGRLDVLYDGDSMIGMEGVWGREKPEQRLLYCEKPYMQESGEPKPAIMARIISPEVFVRVIRLRDEVREKEVSLRLWIEDPLIAANRGGWMWRLNHEASWLERDGGARECGAEAEVEAGAEECLETGAGDHADVQPETGWDMTLTVEEMTAWLFGYEVPEAARKYAALVETLERVFLDEVV